MSKLKLFHYSLKDFLSFYLYIVNSFGPMIIFHIKMFSEEQITCT